MLKPFQTIIQPDTLYRVYAENLNNLNRSLMIQTQIKPTIECYGEECNVHGSQIFPDSAPTGMPIIMATLTGIQAFDFIPNYIYVAPTGSDPEAIVLSGVRALAIMELVAQNYSETFVEADLVLDA